MFGCWMASIDVCLGWWWHVAKNIWWMVVAIGGARTRQDTRWPCICRPAYWWNQSLKKGHSNCSQNTNCSIQMKWCIASQENTSTHTQSKQNTVCSAHRSQFGYIQPNVGSCRLSVSRDSVELPLTSESIDFDMNWVRLCNMIYAWLMTTLHAPYAHPHVVCPIRTAWKRLRTAKPWCDGKKVTLFRIVTSNGTWVRATIPKTPHS